MTPALRWASPIFRMLCVKRWSHNYPQLSPSSAANHVTADLVSWPLNPVSPQFPGIVCKLMLVSYMCIHTLLYGISLLYNRLDRKLRPHFNFFQFNCSASSKAHYRSQLKYWKELLLFRYFKPHSSVAWQGRIWKFKKHQNGLLQSLFHTFSQFFKCWFIPFPFCVQ